MRRVKQRENRRRREESDEDCFPRLLSDSEGCWREKRRQVGRWTTCSWEKKKRGKWRMATKWTGVCRPQGPPLGAAGVRSGGLRGSQGIRPLLTSRPCRKKKTASNHSTGLPLPSAGPKTRDSRTYGESVLITTVSTESSRQTSSVTGPHMAPTDRSHSRRFRARPGTRLLVLPQVKMVCKLPTSQAESTGEWG